MNYPLSSGTSAPWPGRQRLRWVVLVFLFVLSSAMATSAATLRLPLTVTEDAGVARTNSPVTSGVPFPMGALSTNSNLRLLDEQGREVPLQFRVTATWRDGSVKWALLDFQTKALAGESRHYTLEATETPKSSLSYQPLLVTNATGEIELNTGPLKLIFSRAQPGFLRLARLEQRKTE
ncbi:MAG TPA: hypothetical protein VEC99_02160, partial [Clostridia bacterium]|nr:hypothetical protein [Clostridia bacterium]